LHLYLSDFLNKQIQQQNISPDNTTPVKQTIDELTKEGINDNMKRSSACVPGTCVSLLALAKHSV
jgi:hypothetical protein